RRLRAPTELARPLGMNAGDTLLYIRRLLVMADAPTVLEDIWLPALLFRGLTLEVLQAHDGPTYALFEKDYDVRMIRAEEKLRAVLPSPEQAGLLQCSTQTPLLQVERVSYTYNDKPVEVRRALNRTDHHYYRNTLG
ncbi:MAG: UTRA domain-containing protein, partial [Brachymonas sp.]|nr:UTRA domain-containing protein [Brachymonas sp.]